MLLRGANGRAIRLLPDIDEATKAALYFGLPGAPSAAPTDSDWRREAGTLVAHRLSGLALAAIRAHGYTPPADIEDRLRKELRFETLHSMRVEVAAGAVIRQLDRAGIRAVVTKGPGTARAYVSASHRPFRDVDILVHPSTFVRAMGILASLRYAELPRDFQPRAFFNRYCREAVNLFGQDGSIDLHHHIPPWIWGRRLQFDDVWAQAQPIEIGGEPLPALSPVHNLLVTALHVISDKGRPGRELLIWRDLASLAHSCDPKEVVREARATKLDWWLRRVLEELPESVRPGELAEALGDAQPHALDTFRLRRLLPPGLGSRHQIAQAFRLPVPNALAFLAGYTLPSRRFLHTRYAGDGSYRRWWRDAGHRIHEAAHEGVPVGDRA